MQNVSLRVRAGFQTLIGSVRTQVPVHIPHPVVSNPQVVSERRDRREPISSFQTLIGSVRTELARCYLTDVARSNPQVVSEP